MNEISFVVTGNLIADPEVRFTAVGRAVATVRFAINIRKRTTDGGGSTSRSATSPAL